MNNIDATTYDGALRLSHKIAAFWRTKGRSVIANVVQVTDRDTRKAPVYGVRSDMMNGLPRQ